MRLAMFTVMLFLLSTVASAYSTTGTDTPGSEPVVSGDKVAFLTYEPIVDKDLDDDGDQADYVVQIANAKTGSVKNTALEGAHPAFAGSTIAFESKPHVLALYNTDTSIENITKIRAMTPSSAGRRVAFATKEDDLAMDLNGDGDTVDPVIQLLNLDTGKTTNTKAVGNNPVMLDQYAAFETAEDAIQQDLNGNGNLDDTIIRYYDIAADKVYNTKVAGQLLAGAGSAIIVSDKTQFWIIDLKENTKQALGVRGEHPTLDNDVLVYDRDGLLHVFRISTGVERTTNIAGTEPSLQGMTLAFVDDKKNIAIIKGEDLDGDAIADFADNCPDASNADQNDTNKNTIGDACEKNATTTAAAAPVFTTQSETPEPAPVTTPSPTVNAAAEPAAAAQAAPVATAAPAAPAERKPLPDNIVLQQEKSDKNPTYWFLVAVGLTAVGILLFIVPRWMKRRRKSYGF